MTNIKKIYFSGVVVTPRIWKWNKGRFDKIGGEWDPHTVIEVSVYDYTVLCSAWEKEFCIEVSFINQRQKNITLDRDNFCSCFFFFSFD